MGFLGWIPRNDDERASHLMYPQVLKWLPVTHNQAIDGEAPSLGDSPIKTVIRSKGFMWMSNNHLTAYFWSHAGQHFEIRDEGDW